LSLAGYDAWKLATPPDADEEAGLRECGECGEIVPHEQLDEELTCQACLYPPCSDCGGDFMRERSNTEATCAECLRLRKRDELLDGSEAEHAAYLESDR
jgi:hypothetical protein